MSPGEFKKWRKEVVQKAIIILKRKEFKKISL